VTQRTESAVELADIVAGSPELQEQMRADPAGTLQRLAAPLETDVWIYRTIVGALGMTMLLVIVGSCVLVLYDKPIPDVLVAIGTAAVGAIAGLLAPSPGGR
jgi:hypothetical protein